jgi:hypothetical protein
VKHIELGTILDRGQIDAVLKIGNDPARVTSEVIEPSLQEINKRTGQENDARYLGYALCFVLERAGAWSNPASFLDGLN